ncbi:MAG TPA: NADPH-dependent F420 reductase [Anaerolineaceae bacterium]|nr:NADPH-dependent F420 reductase [Anaerolineaceae bacterium]
MDFTIIGAGNMGRGIATRMLSGGNPVVLIDREPGAAEKLAAELRPQAAGEATVRAARMGEPITTEAVVLAVYYPSVPSILSLYRDQLAGKIVVDIINPLNETFDDLATPPGTSAAEQFAAQLPPEAKVLKAFNTTFAGTLVAGEVAGQELDIFIAGEDEQAKAELSQALDASGLRPIDVGPLRLARQLEGLGLLHITLQGRLGTDWSSTVKILH